jgi:hypothetical protein
VSHFKLGDIDHLVVRPEGAEEKPAFDERPLPQFLFLGAGIMTLGVLLVLWRRVRDLVERSFTLVRSLFGPRLIPEGLVNLPGDGPVVLLIETADPAAIRATKSAVDRYVAVFEPKTADAGMIETALIVLYRGDVVGVLMAAPAGPALADALEGLKIRVRSEGRLLTFSEPLRSVPGVL